MTPDYRIKANDQDITHLVHSRFVSLSLKDSAGIESDVLTIVLSDDGIIEWPAKGARLDLWIGYQPSLIYKGAFVVDFVSAGGPPDRLTISAQATNVLSLIRTKKSRKWNNRDFANIVSTIANEHGIIPVISDSLRTVVPTQKTYQLNESDMHFLSRIAKDVGAIAKTKAGRLLFVEQGLAKSASGQDMPVVELYKKECSSWNYEERGFYEYDRVVAVYRESRGRRSLDFFGKRYFYTSYRYSQYVAGNEIGRTKELPKCYESQDLAKRAALAEFNRNAQAESKLQLKLKVGIPELLAETRLNVHDFKERINRQNWVVDEVTHTLNKSGGLQSSLSASRLLLASNKI